VSSVTRYENVLYELDGVREDFSQNIFNAGNITVSESFYPYYQDFAAIVDAHEFFSDSFEYNIPFVTIVGFSMLNELGFYCHEGHDDKCDSEDRILSNHVGVPGTFLHEYGHHIQHKLYQSLDSSIPPCGEHFYARTENAFCSWTEGWSWFIPSLVWNSSVVDYAPFPVFDLESGTYTENNVTTSFPSSENGRYSEGLVASALWDIHDSINEDGDDLSGRILDIWDAFDDSPAQTILEWEAEWDDNGDPSLDSIFNLNRIRLSSPTTITSFSDDFESDLSKWVLSGDSDWEIGYPHENVPGEDRIINDVLTSHDCDSACTATISATLDTQNPLTVSFDRFVDSGADAGEGLFVEYSADDTVWTSLASYTHNNDEDDDSWNSESLSLDITENTAKIKFVAKSSTSSEHIEIDNVMITESTNSPPDVASIQQQSVNEGRMLLVTVSASDPDGDAITLSAPDLPSFAMFSDEGDGTGTLMFSPGYRDSGRYTVTVTASDGVASDSESFMLTVINVGGGPSPPPPSQDTTPPAVTVPSDVTTEATGVLTSVSIG